MPSASTIRGQMSSSNFLKGSDLGPNASVDVTISKVEQAEQERDGRTIPQILLHFEGKEKKLGLNVGNLDSMIQLYGDETDNWVGKQVNLFTIQTQNPQGQPALGIRINAPTNAVNTNEEDLTGLNF